MSQIYRSRVTSRFRTKNLLNFYETVGDENEKTGLYLTFGRTEPWSENENEPGFAPPYPSDDAEGYADLWNRMIGAAKIGQGALDAVIPRKDWGDIRVNNPFRFYIGDIICTNTIDNVNVTERGEGIMVYRCVDVPDTGECSISSITEKDECMKLGGTWNALESPGVNANIPRGQGDAIDTQDGYVWEYLYTIPAEAVINRVTREYIVVPFPSEALNNPEEWRITNTVQWNPNDNDIIYRTRCTQLRFKAFLDSIEFPEASKPGNSGFRQIGLLINPLEKKNSPSDPDIKAIDDVYLAKQLEHSSGEVVYMENRRPIIRAFDQVEEVNIVFDF